MSRDDLVYPVAEEATTQGKLCPYYEEDPHILFRLIEAQFPQQESNLKNSNMPVP
jgi:hypothetical protein